jgi:hypothetical protein
MNKIAVPMALLIAGVCNPALLNAQPVGEGPTETDEGQLAEPAGMQDSAKIRGELYGFAMLDMGYNAGTINEDWFDTMRPTQLPSSDDQKDGIGPGGDAFPTEGNTYASVRQSRLGVKGWFPTDIGEIFTIFEIEMFGVGVDAGQTTIRLRHAYGEVGAFGAGQYWSPFMDIDVFPNSQEYWGPSGMPFFRNVQVRWMPIRGTNNLTFALERPGAGRDPATDDIEDLLSGRNIRERYPYPDLSASYKYDADWGYLRAGAILRQIEWEDDTPNVADDLSGDVTGWGINLSANFKFGPNDSVLKVLVVHGEAIENYMNDAGGDIGIKTSGGFGEAEAIPVTGTVLFYDLYWSKRWSSTIGFSTVDKDLPSGTAANALEKGRYALTNLQYHPTPALMVGAEVQYGRRENFNDGYDYDAVKVQFSARYNFSFGLGG